MFQRRHLTKPFAELLAAMRRKDPALYEEIADRTIGPAIDRWRQVHPEDFPADHFIVVVK